MFTIYLRKRYFILKFQYISGGINYQNKKLKVRKRGFTFSADQRIFAANIFR